MLKVSCFNSNELYLSSFLKKRLSSESVQSPILVEPVQSTSSSVTLEWSYNEDDPAHTAFITGYLVTGQEAGTDTLPGHVASKCGGKLQLLIIIHLDLFLFPKRKPVND